MGFLWGSAAVSMSCGFLWGLAEARDWAGRPGTGTKSRRLPDLDDHFPVTQCYQDDLPACSNSAPADYGRLTTMPARMARTDQPTLEVLIIQCVRSA